VVGQVVDCCGAGELAIAGAVMLPPRAGMVCPRGDLSFDSAEVGDSGPRERIMRAVSTRVSQPRGAKRLVSRPWSAGNAYEK
jgi:hypothetical protein